MRRFPAVFDLVPDQVAQIVQQAGLAPSPRNSQPWRFRVLPNVIELHAAPAQLLPTGDPGDHDLRLACGAALLNLRLALAHAGVRPVVTLLPRLSSPTVLAEIRSGGHQRPDAEQIALYEAIPARRTQRRPLQPTAVAVSIQHDLRIAARAEGAWLHLVRPAEHDELAGLLRHALQSDAEPAPLLAVLCTTGSDAKSELEAGQAWQRVWLTATARGLAATPLPLAGGQDIRDALSRLLGDAPHPQAWLLIGYGEPVPATPRRDPGELLIDAIPNSDHG
ncbi:Nitroreductase family protein [Saccharopolyspora shandongensis]|uniref:Nitroreductase family protein n=1 Tax=Saccharopolyspora shandongensis TaxID=418495 RepID=A0A1H2QFC5_9PSEU|nr:nitroreductase family protein [Saccharopolyspora shandongensis]SDW05610.1 Nitroreductase family protein [Saccharopolyspora shandongensis]